MKVRVVVMEVGVLVRDGWVVIGSGGMVLASLLLWRNHIGS